MPHRHPHDSGFHGHGHRHADAPPHRHPHHHRGEPSRAGHDHTHATSFESLTYIVSPVHDLDARAKIVATLLFVLGIVLTPPLHAVEAVLLALLVLAVGVIARLPLGRLLWRSAAVLPFAATIALLAPLQSTGGSWNAAGLASSWSGGGWMITWGILSKAWFSAFSMIVLAASTRTADFLAALRRLKIPDVFVMLLSFIARYVAVLGGQLRSLRIALVSRAPRLSGRALLRSSGSLAGNLFVRSYERGERVYQAMLSRGYTGTLPAAPAGRIGAAEVLFVLTALLTASAVALY